MSYRCRVPSTDRGDELFDALEAVEAASPVDAVDAVTGKLAAALGTDRVTFLIADLAGRALIRLQTHRDAGPPEDGDTRRSGAESARQVPLSDGVVAGVLREQHPIVVPDGTGWRVLAPVTQRGEAVGVLEVGLAAEPDDRTVHLVRRAAHLLAFVVIANRRHTDLFEWGQRSVPFKLSAEIQRRLLPGAFTCEASAFTLSAWLEPAATIGGDTFDYSLERDLLHLSMTDAMGHGVASALSATLCVGALRHSRRSGASLVEQAAEADRAMRDYRRDSFVTGLLGRLDLRRGRLALVNAGHVPPLLLRADEVRAIGLPIDLPFGFNTGRQYRSTEVELRPGDRFVVVTDGMQERQAAQVPLTGLLRQTRKSHPREAVRHLADAVVEAAGQALDDDATILMLDWHGEHGHPRDSRAGADRERADSAEDGPSSIAP
jgi:serine phosphatase RsbU (regulator of sigma subunit)